MIALVVAAIPFATDCGKEDLYTIPESPFTLVSRLPLPSLNMDVAVLDGYAFVAANQAGFHVVDISDPANPILVDTINTPKAVDDIEVMRIFPQRTLWDVALIVEGTEGIRAFDITDPLNAEILPATGSTAIDVNSVFIELPPDPDESHAVYQAEGWKGVRVLFSDPDATAPGSYPNESWAYTLGNAKDISVKDGWGFVADDQMGLTVMDLRVLPIGPDETTARVAANIDTPGNALSIEIEGDYAFVADKRQGMSVFDISNPEAPVRVTRMPLDGWCLDIELRDGYAFIAGDDAGLHIVDITSPTHPVLAGQVSSSNATGVGLSPEGLVLVTDEDDGLLILQGPGPFIDRTPPGQVFNLFAEPRGPWSVELSWYPTGDDGYLGEAQSVEIRYAEAPIADETAWDAATPMTGLPVPGAIDVLQVATLFDLTPDSEYHFAIKLTDDTGLVSPLSPGVSAATPIPGTYVLDFGVSADWGLTSELFTFEATYFDDALAEPIAHDVVIDGDPHDMDRISGDNFSGALYRLTLALPVGEHEFSFYFDDGDGNVVQTRILDGPVVGEAAFTMGSPPEEPGHNPDDGDIQDEPLHTVLLGHELIAGEREVLQSEWEELMAGNPSTFVGGDLPVEGVTWVEAVQYCNALSTEDGLTHAYTIAGGNAEDVTWDRDADGWRLPTEAEWEYLCRAGSETGFHNGPITETSCALDAVLDASGWYCGNSGNTTHDGGGKIANGEGLLDTHGNVMEWCWDWAAPYEEGPILDPEGPADPDHGYAKAVRGGSWFHEAGDCRSASRAYNVPDSRQDFVGLRVLRTQF